MRRHVGITLQYVAVTIGALACLIAMPLWWLGEKIEGRS